MCLEFSTWLFCKSTNCMMFFSENSESIGYDAPIKENLYASKLAKKRLHGKCLKSCINDFIKIL